jgi:putative DNA primase/helicase
MSRTRLPNHAAELKTKIAFLGLFRELFPNHYRSQANSHCPFHDDSAASFQLSPDHGFCHAGCNPPSGNSKRWSPIDLWMRAKGVDFKTAVSDLAEKHGIEIQREPQPKGKREPVATYDYTDDDGNLLFQVCRFEPKDFRQRRPDGKGGWTWKLEDTRRVLYRLPAVIEADTVWFAEGEKDADNLAALGLCGSTSPQGAGKWTGLLDKFRIHESLQGKTVLILPDNDEAGRQHALDVAASLHGFAGSVRILSLPDLPAKGDVSDFIAKHGSDEAKRLLLEIAEATPLYDHKDVSLLPEKAESINLTDMGNARRMARLFGDRVRYCKQFDWLIYDGKRWVVDHSYQVQGFAKATVRHMYEEAARIPDEDSRKALAAFAMKCESASRIAAMIQLLPSEPQVSIGYDVFDQDRMSLNLANGTLDLRTGQLRPHSKDDFITKLAPVNYDSKATCERWERFVSEIMGGDSEMVGFLQRLLGYSLTGETKEQVWVFLWGKGENGKGTLLEAISHVLGDYAANTPPETFLESSGNAIRNDLARLRGARLITASEPPNRKFDPAVLKTFTGQDPITARFLHREFFEFQPEGKLFFSANHRPAVRDTSHGFWRRVLLIPLTQLFTGEKKDARLRESLKRESPGILNWLVQGCLEWQETGLRPPAKVIDAVADYRSETDVLAEFLENHCFIERSESVSVKDMYASYLGYCDEKGIRKGLSRQKFNEDLLGRPGITKDKDGPTHNRVWTWFGIGLNRGNAQAHGESNIRHGDFGRPKNQRSCDRCDIPPLACPIPRETRSAPTCEYYRDCR